MQTANNSTPTTPAIDIPAMTPPDNPAEMKGKKKLKVAGKQQMMISCLRISRAIKKVNIEALASQTTCAAKEKIINKYQMLISDRRWQKWNK